MLGNNQPYPSFKLIGDTNIYRPNKVHCKTYNNVPDCKCFVSTGCSQSQGTCPSVIGSDHEDKCVEWHRLGVQFGTPNI